MSTHHAPGVQRRGKCDQISLSPKSLVQGPNVLGPVAVVPGPAAVPVSSDPNQIDGWPVATTGYLPIRSKAVDVLDDGRDPDGRETHALDVVQLVYQPFVCSPAIDLLFGVAFCCGRAVGPGESVGDNLVHALLPPLGTRERSHSRYLRERRSEEKKSVAESTHRDRFQAQPSSKRIRHEGAGGNRDDRLQGSTEIKPLGNMSSK